MLWDFVKDVAYMPPIPSSLEAGNLGLHQLKESGEGYTSQEVKLIAHLHLVLRIKCVKLHIQSSIRLHVVIPKYTENLIFTCLEM
jgi:hypothetical protein